MSNPNVDEWPLHVGMLLCAAAARNKLFNPRPLWEAAQYVTICCTAALWYGPDRPQPWAIVVGLAAYGIMAQVSYMRHDDKNTVFGGVTMLTMEVLYLPPLIAISLGPWVKLEWFALCFVLSILFGLAFTRWYASRPPPQGEEEEVTTLV